ncbi:MAG: hypothetical protein KAI72_03000 [Candidatus Pacebacteria bacterium]|nr:hypothetical protein [Candidatus Paceibacterota bacterium]
MTENKSSKKNNKILIILFVFIAVALSIGYIFKDKIFVSEDSLFSEQEKNDQQEVDDVATEIMSATTQGAGKIEPIMGIELEELQVVSLGDVSNVSENGKFVATLYNGTVTPVAAMLPDKEFGLMGLAFSSNEEVSINIQTTAETLVFLSPFLISIDPEISANIMNVIREDKKVKEFAKVIEEVLQKDVEPLDDPEYRQAFGQAIENVLETLNK